MPLIMFLSRNGRRHNGQTYTASGTIRHDSPHEGRYAQMTDEEREAYKAACLERYRKGLLKGGKLKAKRFNRDGSCK